MRIDVTLGDGKSHRDSRLFVHGAAGERGSRRCSPWRMVIFLSFPAQYLLARTLVTLVPHSQPTINTPNIQGVRNTPTATMRSPPPEVLATWPKPNYVDPITRGPSLMIVELTLLPIAMIVVFLRLWVRISWLKKSWYDDYLMIVAMIFSIGMQVGPAVIQPFSDLQRTGTTVIVIMASQLYGWDRHAWDLTPHEMMVGRQVRQCATRITAPADVNQHRRRLQAKRYSSSPPPPSRCLFSCLTFASHQKSRSSESSFGQRLASCSLRLLFSWLRYGCNACKL